MSHALAMRDAMLNFDESKLIKSRVAGSVEYDESDFMSGYNYWTPSKKQNSNSFYDLTRFVENYPNEVAAFLDDMGVTVGDLWDSYESGFNSYGKGRG